MKKKHAKTAVVVGAGSKVGRAITLELTRQGFKVGIVDYGEDDARGTLDMVEREGGEAELYYCDVRDLEQVQAMADHFFAAWGEVGLLVNNPGVKGGENTGNIPVEEWEQVMDINLLGVVYACRSFIPRMVEQGRGNIANGTYGAGVNPDADSVPCHIARAGVNSYTEKLRAELAPCDIGVTMLCSAMTNPRLFDGWLKRTGFDLGVKEPIKG